jgi:hypothetical protein
MVGAGLMGGVAYTHSSDMALGGTAGAILVGALFHGVAAGTMSVITLSAALFGLFFCMIGPGCDDYGGQAGAVAAFFGALIGLVFRRGRSSLPPPAPQASLPLFRPCK